MPATPAKGSRSGGGGALLSWIGSAKKKWGVNVAAVGRRRRGGSALPAEVVAGGLFYSFDSFLVIFFLLLTSLEFPPLRRLAVGCFAAFFSVISVFNFSLIFVILFYIA